MAQFAADNTTERTSRAGRSAGRSPAAQRTALVVALWFCCGCQSLDGPMLSWFRGSRPEETPSIAGIRGPLQRSLESGNRATTISDELTPPEDLALYEKADRLFQDGQYAEAEKQFEKLLKRYRISGFHLPWEESSEAWATDAGRMYRSSRLVEDALFKIAECHYRRGHYPRAQDGYDLLLKEYPSTRHMDRVTRRLFVIARTWLGFPKQEDAGQTGPSSPGPIRQAGFEKSESSAAKTESTTAPPVPLAMLDPSRSIPIFPNFWDRSRPVFDTPGRGLQALKSIWLNDPTGDLADDALMLSAAYYLRKEDYVEADRFLTMLREEYPQSPHLEKAFLLGAHCKWMSYQGPRYDGTKLKEARKLQETLLRMNPNHPRRERIQRGIKQIKAAEARRDWEVVKFYAGKGMPASAAVYCRTLLREHPDSRYAEKARKKLDVLEPKLAEQAPRQTGGSANWYERLSPPSWDQLVPWKLKSEPGTEPEPKSDPQQTGRVRLGSPQ